MTSTPKIKGIDYSRKTQTRREVFSRAQRRMTLYTSPNLTMDQALYLLAKAREEGRVKSQSLKVSELEAM